MLKPRRCNSTGDLTKSVDKGLNVFNLMLNWFYDTKTNLIWARGDPALLTTPLAYKLKYLLSILSVLSLVESYQDSRFSPMWLPCDIWLSPICVLVESHVTWYLIFSVPCVSHALGPYLTYLDCWVLMWSQICQSWPYKTPTSRNPSLSGSL